MSNIIFLLQVVDSTANLSAPYYVIESFPHPHFVTDENGELKIFDNYLEAKKEANDCQDGYVINFSL